MQANLPSTLLVLLPLAVAQPQSSSRPDCAQQSPRNLTINTHSNEQITRIKWETRDCKGKLEFRGNVRVAGDLSGIESIDAGGRAEIESQDGSHERALTLTPVGNRFQYVYEVDGRRQGWDAEGQAWLRSVLQLVVRRGGFGARERVDYLLRTQGVNGVLQEVGEMESDYTQRMYLTRLLDQTKLNDGALRSVLQVAQRELESDYELTEFLVAVASRYQLNDQARAAYIQATTTLASDYERARAFKTVLKQRELSSLDMEQMLKSAAEIRSDYELRQVLNALLERETLSAPALDVLLRAAASLDSDYERAELLTSVLRKYTLTPAQRRQVVELIDGMRSDHERGRISSLLIRQMNSN